MWALAARDPELTSIGHAPGEPIPDSSDISSWRISQACFAPDRHVYLRAMSPDQFQEARLPAMYDNQYGPPIAQCDNGWSSINLSPKP